MKNIAFSLVLGCMLFLLSGCNKPSPATVQSVTTVAVNIGFNVWKQKNPAQEAAVSVLIVQGAQDALDYVQGNQGIATSVLNAAMLAKLTDKLPADIAAVIVSAAGILDQVLPVPSPTTYLTADQSAYIVAFLNGVKNGVPAQAAPKMAAKAGEVSDADVTKAAQKLLDHKRNDNGWLVKHSW